MAFARPDVPAPDCSAAYQRALREIRSATRLPLAFGGPADATALRVCELSGVRTDGLRNLTVRVDTGLGGQVLAQRRPAALHDYGSAMSITHDYDGPVLAEGIRSIMAVPVMVGGTARGVLYGAARCHSPIGERVADAMLGAAAGLAREITIDDEVRRRVEALRAGTVGAREEVRALHAEFRGIAQAVPDGPVRERLRAACDRLAGLGGVPEQSGPRLAPRELDVLAQVALGRTNADAGQQLNLLPETVKAYLRSAMRKLDTHTRYEAVVAARRRGLLP